LLVLLFLLIVLYVLLHYSPVQTWLVKQVTSNLSEKLHTKVTVKKVDFSFFDKLELEGLMIEDQQKDTLLFARSATVKINDWFFVKDKIILHYIGLEDAVVNIKRSGPVWNYQFLADYFSSPASTEKKTNKGIEFDFKEAHFKNIRFNKLDQWVGQDMIVAVQTVDATIDKADLNEGAILLNSIKLEKPYFSQSNYTGKRPDNYVAPSTASSDTATQSTKESKGLQLAVKKLTITDGVFRNEKETVRLPYTDRFDGQHILFSDINASITNMTFNGSDMVANIELAAKEKSGLLVKKLKADFRFTPAIMEFNNLDLITNKSHLKNYYSMSYESFNRDMNSFISNVMLEGNFTDSELNSDDIAIFAPNLSSWKKIFYLNGNAKGTVDNFSVKKMNINSGNSSLTGEITLRGLPDIYSTFIDFKSGGLKTTSSDLFTLVPSLRKVTQPQLSKLGNIYYKGNFTGFINDFVTYGTVVTDLGTITADLNMKLPENRDPVYSGKLVTTNFRLGDFTNSKEVGNISLNGKIKGSGFTLKDLKANFDGYIPNLEFNGYNYQNIFASGDFENERFKGHLTINDPNLVIKNLDGTLSLSGKEIAFDLNADLQYANLKNIHFSKENLSLAGLFSLNFTGNNIDNFLGTARIYDARLLRDSTALSFDSLTLTSTYIDDKKILSLHSNEIDAEVSGKFKILELPDAFKVFLSKYYPTYIKKPSYWVSDQDFSFNIKTKNIEDYLKLFDKKLSGFNNSSITGNLNLSNYGLNILADVPQFGYDGKIFTNTKLQGTGNRDTLTTDIAVDDVALSDSLHFPGTKLLLISSNDKSDIHLNTSAGKTLNNAELNASVQTLPDGVKIYFSPSSFIINDKKWLLEKDGELSVRKKYLDANEIRFVNGQQEIVLSTEMDELTDQVHVVAKLNKVNIDDFAPFAFKKPYLQGLLTGTATLRDPFGKISIDFAGKADSLSVDNQYIGNLNINANANTVSGLVQYDLNTTDTTNIFSVKGTYNYKDSTSTQLDADIVAEKIHLSALEPYLGSIFSKMDGIAETRLKISGGPDHRYITGKALIKDAALKVAYTQCRYFIKNEELDFEKDLIDLGMIRLRDSLQNTATLSGKINHQFFDKLSFNNVKLETAKLALLNTTRINNSQFYGNVVGKAKMSINGPTSNLLMNIDGEPSILDSSHLYLPTGAGKESSAIDYIDFIQFGSQMETSRISESTNIIVTLNVKANQACKVDVILDEETGDIIKGQGNGLINIRVGNKEPLSIRGNYELTRGEYNFNFQTFFKKPFTLNRGTISWNGDPYQANINIDAEYLAKNVDISSLSSSSGFRQQEDITIIAHLTGVLQKPLVSFEFALPERSEAKRDDIVVKRLADFKNDENEMNKQVASLLLFNTFIVGNQNFLSQGNGGSLFTSFTSSIGGMISSLLTNILNKELERATNGRLSTYIDINPTLDLQKSAAQLQANVRAGLKILLSNRLIVLVGGNLDYNNSNYVQQLDRKGLITPDISIEWLINKDGSLRIVGFNRSSIDFTLNQRNRSGIQLSFRKDVDRISDIFKSKKKLEAEARKKYPTLVRPAPTN
jgi:hypothetical protein